MSTELEINQLIELQKRNEEIFEKFYQQVFGKEFGVHCDWGFPNFVLDITYAKGGKDNRWIFNINTVKGSYILKTKSSTRNEKTENFVPDYATISSDTINYVIDSAMKLSTQVLRPSVLKTQEEQTKIDASKELEKNETEETKKVE